MNAIYFLSKHRWNLIDSTTMMLAFYAGINKQWLIGLLITVVGAVVSTTVVGLSILKRGYCE